MPQRVCLLFHASSANLSVSRAQREVQRHLFWRKADGRRQFQSHPTQRKRRMGPNLAGVFYATVPFRERFFRVSHPCSALKRFTPGISNSVGYMLYLFLFSPARLHFLLRCRPLAQRIRAASLGNAAFSKVSSPRQAAAWDALADRPPSRLPKRRLGKQGCAILIVRIGFGGAR